MNYSDLYPSRFLKASDIDGHATVVIESLNQEEIGRDKEVKPILRFKGVAKPMVLNRTNATAISKIHGKSVLEWPGKPVQLYTTTVEAGGESFDAIRIRAPETGATGAKAASQAPLSDRARQLEPVSADGDPGPERIDRSGDEIPF